MAQRTTLTNNIGNRHTMRTSLRAIAIVALMIPSVTVQADDWYFAFKTSVAVSTIDDITHKGTIGTGAQIGNDIDGKLRDTEDDDVTAGIGLALGRTFGAWAIEADYHWRYRTDWDASIPTPSIQTMTNLHTNIESSALMLNAIRSGALGEKWRWQIGIGAGMTFHDFESDYIEREVPGVRPQMRFSDEDSSTEFTWSVLGGVSRALGEAWRFNLRYHYTDFGDLEVGPYPSRPGRLFAEYSAHEIYASLERDL